MIEVDNGELEFAILPTRGMSILRGWYRNLDLTWDSHVKDPAHPAFIDLNDRGCLGWLKKVQRIGRPVRARQQRLAEPGRRHRQQLERRRGISSFHEKIANIPARQVPVEIADDGTITITGQVDETMMFGPALRLTMRISRRSGPTQFASWTR